jgi:flagellar basal-body rod protein FlgF
MDKLLYTSTSAVQQIMQAQSVNSNNLANVSTTGFRADFVQALSVPIYGEGIPSRVYSETGNDATDFQPGNFHTTGRALDIAIQGDGFIAVQGKNGVEGYTRAGDLRIAANGQLTTGTGLVVMGEGGPITIPPSESIEIGVDGSVSVRPLGSGAEEIALLDRIKLVNPELRLLQKGRDGLLRLRDGSSAPLDANIRVTSGTVEGSNVNAIGAMVKMIELQRKYEAQIKMMQTADENSQASARMLQLPG